MKIGGFEIDFEAIFDQISKIEKEKMFGLCGHPLCRIRFAVRHVVSPLQSNRTQILSVFIWQVRWSRQTKGEFMKQYAIGDVHGCFTALRTLVDLVNPKLDDQIIMLGDYVDRGPNSRGVLQWLIDQQEARNLVCLRGNHEIMMLDARADLVRRRRWGKHGGGETWDSYEDATNEAEGLEAVPDEHWQFMENLLPYHETDTHIFVHAAAYSDMPMNEQPDFMLFWERFEMIAPREDGKTIVCGHTSQKSGLPKCKAHAICIDTNACRGGWLTCLDVETGKYFQANQEQETRQGWIDELD